MGQIIFPLEINEFQRTSRRLHVSRETFSSQSSSGKKTLIIFCSCSSPSQSLSARASSRPLTPLRAPVRGGTRFPVTPGFSDLLNPFRPSAASPRPQPKPHPERLWDAGRGPGRQRNGRVNNRLWMARAPVLCVPVRTRQPHEAHRGGDQPGVDPVAVQDEAGGRGERHPVLRHPDRDLRGGGCGHHVEGQEGEMEGRVEL